MMNIFLVIPEKISICLYVLISHEQVIKSMVTVHGYQFTVHGFFIELVF